MVDSLVADLRKEATAAEVEEKNSQEAYEKLKVDTREKRAQEAKPVGPYRKKTNESAGVLTMVDLLVADLHKEATAV